MSKERFACLICGDDITDTEFEYEDYYTVFRGHNHNKDNGEDDFAIGYLCFQCIRK